MIITRSWLQEWIDISQISTENIIQSLNSIGLEVSNHYKIVLPEKVVVGYIKTKSKHENSDHLSVCEVDVGSEILQIVCGAQNVAVGQYVCVSLIGARIGDITIKKSRLRGVDSNGMICSAKELGIGDLNDGILVLDDSIGDIVLGKELREYTLLNDEIIEVDLTPNRGDCLSVYGIARDLAAYFDLLPKLPMYEEKDNLLGIGRIVSIHSIQQKSCAFQYRAFEITNKSTIQLDLLRRLRIYFAQLTKKIKLDEILAYCTYSTGVLLRAYDFKKICPSCVKIVIDIKEEESGNYGVYVEDKRLSLAGIIQEKAQVDDETQIVLIEANYTSPHLIAKAVGSNKELVGDTHVYNAIRGSEPDLNVGGDFLFSILSKFSGLNLYAGFQQILPNRDKKVINFSINSISNMVGRDLINNDIVKILKKLNFEVDVREELISIKIPFYRHDIENSHDICEEIVRMIGIDNIPSKPLKFRESNNICEQYFEYKNKKHIRLNSVANGFFECLHYVFDSKDELLSLGFKECRKRIINPINSELNMLRPTLFNHILKSCERNTKNSKKAIKLFEIGSVFDEFGKEKQRLAFLASGLKNESSLQYGSKPEMVDFINFASLIQNIIGNFNCVPTKTIVFLNPFEQAFIEINGEKVGYIGRLDLNIERKLKLFKTYFCEVDFDKLKFNEKVAYPYSKFQSTTRDLSFLVPDNLKFKAIKDAISGLKIDELKDFRLVDIYGDDSIKGFKSYMIKFVFQSHEKTLEDNDLVCFIDKIIMVLKNDLDIGLR